MVTTRGAWVNSALGLNTHNSAYPCNLCVVKSDKLSLYKESAITAERAAGGLKRRTLKDERVRAHDFDESTPPAERKCPCCTLRFPTPADAQKYVAEMTKTAAKEYPSKHYGKRPGQSPLWKGAYADSHSLARCALSALRDYYLRGRCAPLATSGHGAATASSTRTSR